ncbi:uncharacterized protein CTRU02_214781 [Colletotrichum truncatum]|uniref:Uncharacterized protein n=1 Tax=Colletotrichum truncatum TaxID=5467 RepID=A0ACC3YFT1_COLTU|nr:uncharacterized protein CTRU02_09731 [Colletotrichum truncatum]KAF6788413.1 hypothetical protein CTRU02_09731 [Colletotrichum truncatum]
MSPLFKFVLTGFLAINSFIAPTFGSPINGANGLALPRDNLLSEGESASFQVSARDTGATAGDNVVSLVVRRDTDPEHSLAKRVFTSPHVRRAFKVVTAGMIHAVSWTFDFWFSQEADGTYHVHYGGLKADGITNAKFGVTGATLGTKSPTSAEFSVPFLVEGTYNGQPISIKFAIDAAASAGITLVEKFTSFPIAYINNKFVAVTSYDLVKA